MGWKEESAFTAKAATELQTLLLKLHPGIQASALPLLQPLSFP